MATLGVGSRRDPVRPLSLGTGDFDRDGVADLLVGYGVGSRGVLVLYRGNVDAIYPNAPDAIARRRGGASSDLPFLVPGRVHGLAERPDHLVAGDFDGDRLSDVVVASEGGRAVSLLAGDGAGGLGPAVRVTLPGVLTAMASGEIDRADGQSDLVLAVVTPGGPRLLLYRSPSGAMKTEPETIDLPTRASVLLLGRLDEDTPVDLLVAAGRNLLIVRGRDRLLPDVPSPAAVVERIGFATGIERVALGDFDADLDLDLALLFENGAIRTGSVAALRESSRLGKDPARSLDPIGAAIPQKTASQALLIATNISSSSGDDLLIAEPENGRIRIAVPSSSLQRADASIEELDPLTGMAKPKAILPMRLNGDALADLVVLKEDDDGEASVGVTLTSPSSVFTVTSTADSGTGSLRAAIGQANANPGADTIVFSISPGGAQTIRPLSPLPPINESVTIDGTTQPGFAGSPIIELDGSLAGTSDGLDLFAGSSVIRGLVVNRWIPLGIYAAAGSGHIVEGCFIGTNLAGTAAAANTYGVSIGDGNTVGGTTANAGNVISGNAGHGVSVFGSNNVIKANRIGTNKGGTAAVGNTNGIKIWSGTNNLIGGDSGANLISGNAQRGIDIGGEGGHRVFSNFIGSDVNCVSAIPNGLVGIEINGSPSNTVAGNFISGNGRGIDIVNSGSDNNAVISNSIGTNCSYTALGNALNGVRIMGGASGNIIGGSFSFNNTIAFNGQPGVFVESGSRNRILSNRIYDNGGLGIDLGPGVSSNGVTPNDVGDPDTGANNLQNFPDVIQALACTSTTRIEGGFYSTPNASFRIQLFSNPSSDPSGHGEGIQLLSVEPMVTTDGTGFKRLEVNLPAFLLPASFVTATATDALGNTSEFSSSVAVFDIRPSGEVSGLAWAPGSKSSLVWLPLPGTHTYRVHRGTRESLPGLLTSNTDACWRYTTSAPSTSTGPVLTEVPPTGTLFWYLVRPVVQYCEGSAGFASAGPRTQNSSLLCSAGSCSHSTCDVGGPLVSGCDPCATAICAEDATCCTSSGGFWDAVCVEEVRKVCGSLACSASQGNCAHAHCTVGNPLNSGCDDPPVTPGCVSRICAVDSYCCTTFWDGICVDEVVTICGQSCY